MKWSSQWENCTLSGNSRTILGSCGLKIVPSEMIMWTQAFVSIGALDCHSSSVALRLANCTDTRIIPVNRSWCQIGLAYHKSPLVEVGNARQACSHYCRRSGGSVWLLWNFLSDGLSVYLLTCMFYTNQMELHLIWYAQALLRRLRARRAVS